MVGLIFEPHPPTAKKFLPTSELYLDLIKSNSYRIYYLQDIFSSPRQIVKNESFVAFRLCRSVRCVRDRRYCRSVCANIRRAIKGGKPARLHRITDRRAINNNARLAKCAGKICAQYPFATTKQGGKGAFVKSVPR
ncbi:Hypothetical predicted protein, partial [Paramuricea clavata]